MDQILVTIATFADAATANIAKNYLTDAGIRAVLSDVEAVSMAWHLSGAYGGVKLLVAETDVEQALEILADETPPDPAELEQAWKVPAEDSEPGTDPLAVQPAVEDDVPTKRELTAVRAIRGAIMGLFFFPIELFVCWLLLNVIRSTERLRPKYRGYAIVAAVIGIPLGAFAALLLLALVLLFASGGFDLLFSPRRY